jgi:hypothetical protein
MLINEVTPLVTSKRALADFETEGVTMTQEAFAVVFDKVLQLINDRTMGKAKEYTQDGGDRFNNFWLQASQSGGATTPLDAMQGNMSKHSASILEYLKHDKEFNTRNLTEKMIDEIVYKILTYIYLLSWTLTEDIWQRVKETD